MCNYKNFQLDTKLCVNKFFIIALIIHVWHVMRFVMEPRQIKIFKESKKWKNEIKQTIGC